MSKYGDLRLSHTKNTFSAAKCIYVYKYEANERAKSTRDAHFRPRKRSPYERAKCVHFTERQVQGEQHTRHKDHTVADGVNGGVIYRVAFPGYSQNYSLGGAKLKEVICFHIQKVEDNIFFLIWPFIFPCSQCTQFCIHTKPPTFASQHSVQTKPVSTEMG